MNERRYSTIGPLNPDFRASHEALNGRECIYLGNEGHLKVGTRKTAAYKGTLRLRTGERIKIFLCSECKSKFGNPPNVVWTDFNTWIVPTAAEVEPRRAKKKKKKS